MKKIIKYIKYNIEKIILKYRIKKIDKGKKILILQLASGLGDYIGARKYFYPLTKKLACYGNDFSRDGTPVADYISASVLALPLYADLSFQDVDRICNIISRK